jgi:hypothetical protein
LKDEVGAVTHGVTRGAGCVCSFQVENYNKKYRFFTSVVVILAVREVVLLVAESPSLVVVQFVVALSHTLFMEVPSCVPGFRMQPPLLCAQRIVLGAVLASYV